MNDDGDDHDDDDDEEEEETYVLLYICIKKRNQRDVKAVLCDLSFE